MPPARGTRLPLAACAADARASCYKRQPGLRGVAGRKVVNSDHTQDTHVILVLNTGQRTYFGISCVSCVVPQRGQSPWPGRAQSTQSQCQRDRRRLEAACQHARVTPSQRSHSTHRLTELSGRQHAARGPGNGAPVSCVSAAARTRDRSETRRERPSGSARLFSPLSAVTSYTFGVSSKPLSVRPSTARLAVVGGRRRQEGGPTIDCTRDRTGGRRTRLARCTCFPTPTPYPASGPTCLAVARARLAASRRSRGQTRPLGPMRCAAASAARSLRRVLGHSGSRAAAAAAAP